MSDRGIKKWAPYKTLSEQDFNLKKQKENEAKIEKPMISSDMADEINSILVNYHDESLKIGYYKNGKIYEIVDKIKKIDIIERKIYLQSKKIILLSDIISMEIYEEIDEII